MKRNSETAPRERKSLPRNRLVALGLILLSAAAGLASRRWSAVLPGIVARYAGDFCWALACFALLRLLLPRQRLFQVFLLALACSVGIELSQLWHPAWLDSIRHTAVGGLLLGFGFRWSDLLCYLSGTLAGWGVMHLLEADLVTIPPPD